MNGICSLKGCPRYGQELDDDGICRPKKDRKKLQQATESCGCDRDAGLFCYEHNEEMMKDIEVMD